MNKTKEVIDLFIKLGLEKELERASYKKEKTRNARRRGRHYKKAKGPLVVVSKKCSLLKSASNIPGVDIVEVQKLNAELLAPGTECGRLTLFTKDAIDMFEKYKLFTNFPVKFEEKKTVKKIVEKQEINKVEKKDIKKTETKAVKTKVPKSEPKEKPTKKKTETKLEDKK